MAEAGLAAGGVAAGSAAAGRGRRPARSNASSCRSSTLNDLDGQPLDRHVVFGQVVGIHIDDRFIKDGRLDTAAMEPIARCGYADYAVVDKVFAIARPAGAEARRPTEISATRYSRTILTSFTIAAMKRLLPYADRSIISRGARS